ncbi:DUF5819 family protein [Pseudonocardia sp. TMWB2A]|uniref:DUF5819 family protein n=1 Tax=Pseudonocardia sp. TMWB2A TaxID=687430 RepID=UPI00307EAC1C
MAMTALRDPRATVLVALLATWWVVMSAGNLPWVDPKQVRRHERWGSVVPNWKFFTPNPISYDDYLHVRTVAGDGSVGPWFDAAPVASRTVRHVVWFPDRRRDRALSNILPAVGRAATKGDMTPAAAELRVLDGMAAHAVRDRSPHVPAYQFSVLRCRGEGGPQNRQYVSSVRPLR